MIWAELWSALKAFAASTIQKSVEVAEAFWEASRHLAIWLASRSMPARYGQGGVIPLEPERLRSFKDFARAHPIFTAFALSLIIHTSLYGGWHYGRSVGWWEHQATWLLDLAKKVRHPFALTPEEMAKLNISPPEMPEREVPMTFVNVDPALKTQPPKDARHYSTVNALAANPDPKIDTLQPRIEGKQDKIPKLEDTPRPKPEPMQPAPPTPPQPAQPEPALIAKPKPAELPGDLATSKPAERKPSDGEVDVGLGQAEQNRPKSLREARAQKNIIAGETMKQDGGVQRKGRGSLDVKASPFGSYDAAFIAAVQQRWYDLLDSTRFTQRSGKVVLEFKLTYDGRITEMKQTSSEVGEILALICQRAVMDPAPYQKWPSDMLRAVGKNQREVMFTFHYY